VIICPVNDYATVLEIEFKTEFLTMLYKRYKEQFAKSITVEFTDWLVEIFPNSDA
jgi:hypothetical protein